MILIDTHTHLFGEAFNEDRTIVVERAIESGVEIMLLPNIDTDTIDAMYSLCGAFPKNCFPMMGLHPGSVDKNYERKLEIIHTNLFSKKHVAVGEIGIDLYWDKSFIQQQTEVFKQQVVWAKELKLPIVIHAREAFDEIFSVIDELNDSTLTGIFHCFTGTLEQAKHIKSYGGFKLGIGGVLTYPISGLGEVLSQISIDDLVLETDSPYLPPVPYRGKRNESSYLIHIAEKIAGIYSLPLNKVAEITTNNARNLFDLDPSINDDYSTINNYNQI